MEWGRLAAMHPGPTVEALIAATAITHRLTLVTRNGHFGHWRTRIKSVQHVSAHRTNPAVAGARDAVEG